jgi:hypothetical protein
MPYGFGNDCSYELGYRGSFAPAIPSYFVVQLDRQGRVISADPINSP